MKALLATAIAAILSLFGIHQAPLHTASTPPRAQVASAGIAVEDPFHPVSNNHGTATPHSATIDSKPSPQSPVINQPARLNDVSRSGGYITQPVYTEPVERVVERIIQSPPMTSGRVLGASAENGYPQNFATVQQLADLQNQINALANLPRSVFVPSFTGPAASTPVSFGTFAQGQRIDTLSGTSLSNVSVSGVSGLTDADIPDSLTASGYLPLSGGTLSGDLTMSGTLTAGTLSVAALSSGGAIEGPYVNATSTTATSTFAGGLTAGTNGLAVLQSGRVGVGTTNPMSPLNIISDSKINPRLGNADSNSSLLVFGVSVPAGYNYIQSTKNGSGITRPLRVYSAGTAVATFDTTGNVGIATTSPWGLLSINPNGISGPSFVIGSSTATSFIVTNGGNVGIGTTTPPAKLTVVDASGTEHAVLDVRSINAGKHFRIGDSQGDVYTYDIGRGVSTNSGLLNFYGNQTGATGFVFGGIDGERMRITSTGNVGIGTTTPWGKLSIKGTGTGTGKALVITDSSNVERMVVQDNGNVGIGTTNPGSPLHVLNGSTAGLRIGYSGQSNNYYDADIQIWRDGNTTDRMRLTGGNLGIGTSTPWGKLSIKGTGTGTGKALVITDSSNVERMVVQDNGNVGIGTTGPGETLEVAGNLKFSGDNRIYLGGNTYGVLNRNVTSADIYCGEPADSGKVIFRGTGDTTFQGNVGIGTTNPSSKFSLAAPSGSNTVECGIYNDAGAAKIGRIAMDDNLKLILDGYSTKGVYLPTALSIGAGSEYASNAPPTGGAIISGNVGIGTTTPWGKLSIKGAGTGTGKALVITDSSDVERMVVQDNGNVGIGTASPGSKLDVRGTGYFASTASNEGATGHCHSNAGLVRTDRIAFADG